MKNLPASLLIPVTPEEEARREAPTDKGVPKAVREAMRCEVIREVAEKGMERTCRAFRSPEGTWMPKNCSPIFPRRSARRRWWRRDACRSAKRSASRSSTP